eukprot:TRINITY_DN1718_c0_g1_i2.p1 TRINITY_DN1718_c0_g1~~TRINITY_DN1718_c0_g1_i2.p1  ORF type:complete len:185 (-),score=37.20 TRINITY_DN1718_c0_g1_i2:267-821(-)
MVIHGYMVIGFPLSLIEWRYFSRFVRYCIGEQTFSLDMIHRILRGKDAKNDCIGDHPFTGNDPRSELMLEHLDPRVHFLLCLHNISSPLIRIISPHTVDRHLDDAASEYCERHVSIENNRVTLPMLFDWYQPDFEQLEGGVWILSHNQWLSNEQKEKITNMFDSNLQPDISYKFDWTPYPKPPI